MILCIVGLLLMSGLCFVIGCLSFIALPLSTMTALYTGANDRFFEKKGNEDQFVNEFIGKLLLYVLDAESHKMTKERIMASNYYLMSMMTEDIMAGNPDRSPSHERRPLDLVNFIAINHNERRLPYLNMHTVTAQARNVDDKKGEKCVMLVPLFTCITIIAIIVITAVYWNSAFFSYSVPIREMNLYFAAICCICTCLLLQTGELRLSAPWCLIHWMRFKLF